MYLTFEQYRALGGDLDEEAFEKAERAAEAVVDDATLGRLRAVDWSWCSDSVAYATFMAMEAAPAIAAEERCSGQQVTSFSNGVNSFGFGGRAEGVVSSARSQLYTSICAVLPAALVSVCVGCRRDY